MADRPGGVFIMSFLTWRGILLQVCSCLQIWILEAVLATFPDCPAEFVGSSSGCYYFSRQSDNSVTWANLVSTCASLHTDAYPVVIESATENDFLFSEASQLPHLHDVWIGSSSESDQPWYSYRKDQMSWYWTDTSSAGFWNWDPDVSIFQLVGSSQKCAIFYAWKSGLWGSQACHSYYGYICEIDIPDHVTTDVATTSGVATTSDVTTASDVATISDVITTSDVHTTETATARAITSEDNDTEHVTQIGNLATGGKITTQMMTQTATAASGFLKSCKENSRRDLVFYLDTCDHNTAVLETVTTQGIIACARECQQLGRCDAFLYDRKQSLCQLLESSQNGETLDTPCYVMGHGNKY